MDTRPHSYTVSYTIVIGEFANFPKASIGPQRMGHCGCAKMIYPVGFPWGFDGGIQRGGTVIVTALRCGMKSTILNTGIDHLQIHVCIGNDYKYK